MPKMTPEIARAARAYLRLTHIELAKKATVSSRTVFKFEDDGLVTEASLERLMAVFDKGGIEMHYDSHGDVIGFTFQREAGRQK